jgi:hypothetical protein
VLAPVLASLALLGGSAQEPVCHGQHSPAAKEQATLEGYAAERASYGFRSDLEYVRELIASDQWTDAPAIPATPAEQGYLRLRYRLGIDPPVYRYLVRRRGVDGGRSVEDGWPGDPYILVRLTRDRAAHEANLLRVTRFPGHLRTAEVRYSVDELNRIARRIYRDWRELEAAGFDVFGSAGHDIATNSVRVRLITKRTDHAEYFAQRYGPVTTEVIATEPTSLECAEADRYEIAPDGRSLVLRWEGEDVAAFERIDLVEHADRVEVGIVERVRNGAVPYENRRDRRRVALSAPLGDRAVVDAASGLRLRQIGPSPGEPPCPPKFPRNPLDKLVQERRAEGLPHGRALVRRRLRRGVEYTKAERRYLYVLEEFFFDSLRLEQYIDRHRDEYGGGEVLRQFPGGPFKLEYFTRRVAFHRANLRRLTRFPRRLRVRRSVHTIAEIEALRTQVQEDADANRGFLDGWGDDGFFVRYAAPLPDRVLVFVITTRDDHAAYFRARYGPAVRTELDSSRHECF